MKRFIIFLLMYMAINAAAQVSPFDYGLREANTDTARYWALYNAHLYALNHGLIVNYHGIDTLHIEIPADFKNIPIGNTTDFGDLVLYCTNRVKHCSLFTYWAKFDSLSLDKATADSGNFKQIPQLSSGTSLLVLRDCNPWTSRRGYGYDVYRSDIIVVKDGIGQNCATFPYNTDSTRLEATFCCVDTCQKVFRNLTFYRTKESTFRTHLFNVSGQYNFLIENITVITPKSRMTQDGIFGVASSAYITFRNINIDGTYSGYGRWINYGYALSLDNLVDSRFEHVVADGNWGVFGCNNMNRTTLINCDINRFDIHCYGRDVWIKHCIFRKKQTQFSSMFGEVVFDSCHFIDCIPVRIRSSFNAYTPFDITMRHCTFEATMRHHSLVNVMLLDTCSADRPEISEKCWPNLTVEDMTVIVPWTVGHLNLFEPTGRLSELKKAVGYIEHVSVKDVRLQRSSGRRINVPVKLSSHDFVTKRPVNFIIQ